MSDEPPQPDWSMLPHQPQRFFGLDDGFDRKDLKRSYNRLIRAFKPETHPAEFQRIRAAYEDLDRALRYGGSTVRLERRPEVEWRGDAGTPTGDGEAPAPGGNSPSRVSLPPSLEDRVQTEPPSEIYAELQAKPVKSPFDYYALALLSDICDRRDGLQFVRWLLEGIKAEPNDYALPRLLQAYLRGPAPEGALPKLLVATAGAIGRDAFYPISEPGWEALLRTASLDEFVATLRKCEAKLRDISIAGKVAFTIRMLRVAQWKQRGATPVASAWLNEAMEFIETNFEQIPPELEYEVDFISAAQEYVAQRGVFAAGGPLRRRLDEALEAYFTSDQVIGDRVIVERQLEIANDADSLIDAFDPGAEDPSVDAFYPLWQWVSYEVAERCAEPEEEEVNYNLWAGRVNALLVQLEAKTDGSSLGQTWNWSGLFMQFGKVMIYIALFVLVLMVFLDLSFLIIDPESEATIWLVIVGVIGGVAAAYFGGRRLGDMINERFYYPFCRRMALKCYRKLWRRDALGLLGRSRLSFHDFRALLAHETSNDISTSIWVSNHISEDYGMAMYALAQRHVV